jgi:AcrR family transcriptional regulator
MTAALALQPRKDPVQNRSRAMVETIVEAAARVLETEGAAGFNTNAVAARAGVSVGSLYQYFPGKQALVAELSRRGAETLLAALEAAADRSGSDLEGDIRRLARAAVAWQGARPDLARALDQLEEGLGLASSAEGTSGRIRDLIIRLLAAHQAAPGAILAEAAEDILALARSLIDRAAARGAIDQPGLENRLAGAICGYLGALQAAWTVQR